MTGHTTALGKPTALINARILDPATSADLLGGLLITNGEITAVGVDVRSNNVPDGAEVIDCNGYCLAPGLIDMEASLGEPGHDHTETIASGTLAAAVGGVTTVISTPDTKPVIDDIALVQFVERQAAQKGHVRVRPMAAITKGLAGTEMAELGLLAEAGAVAFTDGPNTIADAGLFRRALSYATTFDLLICHHAQDAGLAGAGCMNEGEMATRLGLAGIPNAAETIIVERDLALVELVGGRYHAAGISTAESVAAIRRAKDKGLNVSCAAAPQNFALNELEVGDYRTFAKLLPPLRAEKDRLAIIEALADGTIDTITSCHRPEDQESKRRPFAQAAYGSVGLETLLPISLDLFHNAQMSLLQVLEKMTVAPARILDLPAGTLAIGAPADLCLFDAGVAWKIDAELLHSKAKNSAFDGRPVQGRTVKTFVGGELVYDRDAA